MRVEKTAGRDGDAELEIDERLACYRPNVGIVLFNPEARLWLGRRATDGTERDGRDQSFRWQMPQGGIDDGETIATAAFRELREETGITSAELVLITPGWLTYDFPPEHKKKNWKGQRQKWAVMLFQGQDAEVDLTADDHQEFDDWRWGELEEVAELIVPFKKAVYGELTESLVSLRNFLRNR